MFATSRSPVLRITRYTAGNGNFWLPAPAIRLAFPWLPAAGVLFQRATFDQRLGTNLQPAIFA